MSPLVWLVPVVMVTVFACVVAGWAARPKPPADMFDSLKAHQKFVDALERTQAGSSADRSRHDSAV
jgi:hypothetical protein